MRYIFGFLVFLLLIILSLVLIFGHHKSTSTKTVKPMTLPDYASTDASVSETIDGVVNGDDTHRAIKITIDQNSREIDIIQGYSGNVINTKTYPNTEAAYSVFLKSINYSGFTVKAKNPKYPDDPSGQCPDGTREIFKLQQGGKQLSSLWSSSCSTGNFAGNAGLLQELFQAQITDYDSLTSNVSLSGDSLL